jgi:hypothetical protein
VIINYISTYESIFFKNKTVYVDESTKKHIKFWRRVCVCVAGASDEHLSGCSAPTVTQMGKQIQR